MADQDGAYLIVGASRGIGRATCVALAQRGLAVAALCRSPSDSGQLQRTLAGQGAQVLGLTADVTDADAVATAIERAVTWHGGLAGVVYAAGVIEPIGRIGETDPDVWAQAIATNLMAAHRVVRAVLPHLARGGAIINLSSAAAEHAFPGFSAYCASKAGLAMLTRAIHLEYAPAVRSYGLRPGLVDTDMQHCLRGSQHNPTKGMQVALHDPSAPAEAIAWLLTTRPADLSGREIDFDDEAFRQRIR